MSLRLRLLLTLVPLFILGLIAADVATYTALRSFLTSRVDQQVIQAHIPIEQYFSRSPDGGPGPQPGGPPGPGGPFPQGTYGQLRSPTGAVLKSQSFTFSSDTSTHPVLPSDLQPGTHEHPKLITVGGSGSINSYRVYADRTNDGTGDTVIVAVPLADLQATLERLLILELGVSAAVTLVLALAALLIVRRSLQPLERMGATARSIVAQGLNRRVSPAGEGTEVGRLGLALNAMLGELEKAFAARAETQERLQQFVSDASSAQRNTLTSMRGYAELLRRGDGMEPERVQLAARRIEEEAKRLGILVDDLLLLARLDQGRALEHNRVDLEALVMDACADAGVADPGRQVRARIAAPLALAGDDMRLRQVLSNLLRNAIVHTPPGTPIEVVLRPQNGYAVMEVVD